MSSARTSRVTIRGLGSIKVYHPASPLTRSSLHHTGTMDPANTDDHRTQALARQRRENRVRTQPGVTIQ